MLRVQGNKIVDGNGEQVILKGYNVGNWMMLENFMFGFPGVEQQFRSAVEKYAGRERYEYFFDRFLTHFLGEKDIEFMKSFGVNCIRVPFNYKFFESDNEPYQYKKEGFKHLDRLVGLCKKHGVYMILDLHCVQGYQSRDWHCDNPVRVAGLYSDGCARERMKKLWVYIAGYYKDEEIIAGYDLMNEPDATGPAEVAMLNTIYRDVTHAIREVDPKHIIYLSGNHFGQDMEVLDEPFADNLAYTCHYYLDACTSTPMPYPGRLGNILYDRSFIEHQMDRRDSFMKRHNVPCWVGEFGVRLSYPGFTDYRLKCFGDQLDIICEREHHYSIWSYKDVGHVGTATLAPDSEWMRFAADIIRLKKKYFTDTNFKLNEGWGISRMLGIDDCHGMGDPFGTVKDSVTMAIKMQLGIALADMLGRQFEGLSENDLDKLAASFAFENCDIHERRLDCIKKAGRLV